MTSWRAAIELRVDEGYGRTVKRFYETTIHNKAGDCAYAVRRKVEGIRARAAAEAREMEMRRQARREALLRPFRKIAQSLRRLTHR